ncbi:MAG: hypothetical protein RAK22_01480 [Nanoarchaeota archaeon]|nr:hypothetical protein [Nanoarchaeota archaeon]
MEYKIEDEVLLSESEVKERYSDYIESDSEYGKKLIEHMKKNIKIKDPSEAFNDLLALNLNIRDDYLKYIIDVQPSSADQVRAIVAPLKIQISEDNIKKILAVIKKHQ